MSTNVQPDDRGTVRRMQRNATVDDIQAPAAIISYNKWMGGVDRGDQLRQYYYLRSKSQKVYKYIFWFLVDVSITNTYILHKYNTTAARVTPFKTFRLELAKALIGSYSSRKRAAPAPAVANPVVRRPPQPTMLAHFPLKKPTGSQKGVTRCWYCHNVRRPSQRKETMWYCGECMYLCHTGVTDSDCFRAHHASML